MVNDFIILNGKKYKVMGDGWSPNVDRFRRYDTGLTGKTLISDLTHSDGLGGERDIRNWQHRIKCFVNDPDPDNTWGVYDDILEAFAAPYVTFVEHDDSKTHLVGIRAAINPVPRVVHAAITGICHEVYYVTLDMVKVYQ